MSISQFLGTDPDYTLTWNDLTQTSGIPDGLHEQPGLYGILKGGELHYIGRSTNLTQRLGQVIGAMCGGTGLHSGGYRVFARWDELPPGEVQFQVFVGQDMYDQEGPAIEALDPSLNA